MVRQEATTPPPSQDHFQLISEFEDEILESADLIDTTLEENLKNASYTVSNHGLLRAIESALHVQTDDDRVHELAHAIMMALSSDSLEIVDEMRDLNTDEKLINLLLKLASKYGYESSIPSRVSHQGPNYWHDIQTDILRRGRSGTVGMNYRLIVGRNGECKELSLSLDSNILLVMNMLAAHERAIGEFGEEAIQQMNVDMLDDFQTQVEDIRELVTDYSKNDNKEKDDN